MAHTHGTAPADSTNSAMDHTIVAWAYSEALVIAFEMVTEGSRGRAQLEQLVFDCAHIAKVRHDGLL